MLLKATLDTLDGLPDELHENYVSKDGKFVLKMMDGVMTADQIAESEKGLKTALTKERESVGTLKRQLAELQEQYGTVDFEEIERLQAAERERAERDAEAKGQWDSLKQQLLDQHQKDKDAWQAEKAAMLTSLESHLIDAEAERACNELDGNSTLLMPHIKQFAKVVQSDDGRFVVRVMDAGGNPRIDGNGNYLGITGQLKEMRDQEVFQSAFKGTTASGGGTPPDGQPANPHLPGQPQPQPGVEPLPGGDRANKWRAKVDAFRQAQAAHPDDPKAGVNALLQQAEQPPQQ